MMYQENLYSDSAAPKLDPHARNPSRNWKLVSPLFAEIIVDLQARDLKDRLFTYGIPEFLSDEVFVGAQVLVPFGHQDTVGGYVVALKNEFNEDFKLKDIAEVLEPDPFFDKEYIDFLGWLAFNSCAPLTDVVQAAIPASLAPRIKRLVRVSSRLESERLNQIKTYLGQRDPLAYRLLEILEAAGQRGLTITTLRQRFSKATGKNASQFFKSLGFLKQENVIEVFAESTAKTAPKTVTKVFVGENEPKTARQKEILAILKRNNGNMVMPELIKMASTTYSTINRLAEEGMVQLGAAEILRNPLDSFVSTSEPSSSDLPPLTQDQQKVIDVLLPELRQRCLGKPDPGNQAWLLHGVTGSGKTEVYLRLIQEALNCDRTALLLVPEISLTPQLASRLRDRFGDQISVWHSAISPGERYDTWRRLKSGDVKVLLGARSAILAHMPKIGLIILDEEHDGSYKQSSPSPRYNAKEVAFEKARRFGAMVLLGSATPDIGTYYRAKAAVRLLELPERVHKQAMPDVKVIDMRQELSLGNRSILSNTLSHALGKRLEAKEQVILLMNRRGYASHIFCRACGYVARCKNCSVSLVYHKSAGGGRLRQQSFPGSPGKRAVEAGYLSCHHCGYERPVFPACPSCKSPAIKEYGLGTQQVEEHVRQKFPGVRTLRLDSDVTQRKGAYREIFEAFSQGKADILIGTQMVAKGLDIPNVTLVGVLVADAALNMPDYRSTERGFQLLSQVAGRCGRGFKPGEVILQTYNPELNVISWAKNHDYSSFFDAELAGREAFSYPPYSRIVRCVLQGTDPQEVEIGLERLAEELSMFLQDNVAVTEEAVQILGPASCLIERVKNKHRFHILIKVKAGEDVMESLLKFLRNKKVPKHLSLAVDVDALDLL